jgi:Ubiquitin-2 like Rad60 SUMO-like
LMDRILQHYLNLHLKQNVIGLQYNHEILYPKNTLDMYCIPSTGATIIATVHSCNTIPIYGNHSTSDTMNRTTNQVNGSSFANISKKPPTFKGTVITVQLRRSMTLPNGKTTDEVIPISIGTNDTLQLLVDQYQQKQSISVSTTIRLQLDGDTMDLRKTPQHYDIENDDLIDVIIK